MKLLSFFQKRYYPLNTVEVSKTAIKKNYYYLSKLSNDIMVAPVLKSDAYGHGLKNVAKILDYVGAPFFCVDSLHEAYELAKIGVKTPILIMGYINPENLRVKNLPFSYAVYDKEIIDAISKYQKNAVIHIFVDTGMNREGISLNGLPNFVKYIKSFTSIRVEGLMSHLGAANNKKETKKQLASFEKAKEIVHKAGFHPNWFHIASSSGLLHQTDYKNKIGNLARCGISIYGIDPEGKDKSLQPALKLKTTLNQIKLLEKGKQVGYDFTFTAKKDMTMGILPMGYFDGIDRRLSSKGFVEIKDRYCPIIGRVSMNLTTIDIGSVENPQVGDEVIVYSNKTQDKNSILNSSILANTIPYTLLVNISPSTKRILVL